ncbi:hypothetical protein PUN28_013915 [Cardiocondyla obscurior]|uniref:Uncharacterized protein n=1 Tax=Cardiocondyla obscurior TaxID=286306 RepID=A0AAW2F6F2_9HYME
MKFTCLFQLPADIVLIQEKRRKYMEKLGLTVQLFIIVVGATYCEIDSAYICIDKILYKISSVFKAFEICFKSFHVLYALYPPECEHLWLLLQRSFFKMSTKWDKMSSCIMELIKEMFNINKENIN